MYSLDFKYYVSDLIRSRFKLQNFFYLFSCLNLNIFKKKNIKYNIISKVLIIEIILFIYFDSFQTVVFNVWHIEIG